MTVVHRPTPAPVHQQAPPARAAASAMNEARRAARGPLPLMTGTAPDQVRGRLCAALDGRPCHCHQETKLSGVTPR